MDWEIDGGDRNNGRVHRAFGRRDMNHGENESDHRRGEGHETDCHARSGHHRARSDGTTDGILHRYQNAMKTGTYRLNDLLVECGRDPRSGGPAGLKIGRNSGLICSQKS
jgi:hypothetical protein